MKMIDCIRSFFAIWQNQESLGRAGTDLHQRKNEQIQVQRFQVKISYKREFIMLKNVVPGNIIEISQAFLEFIWVRESAERNIFSLAILECQDLSNCYLY